MGKVLTGAEPHIDLVRPRATIAGVPRGSCHDQPSIRHHHRPPTDDARPGRRRARAPGNRVAAQVASQGTGRRAGHAGHAGSGAPAADRGGVLDAAVEHRIRRARGGGRSLPAPVRAGFESALGASFGAVRVHADGEADRLTEAVGARAFTTGQHIFFRRGEYDPADRGGRALIAHELTHVTQEGGSGADTVRRSLLGSAELKRAWAGHDPATTELLIDHDHWQRDEDTGELWYAVATINGEVSPANTFIEQSRIKIAPVGRGLGGKLRFARPIHGGPGTVAGYEVPQRLSRGAEDTFLNRAPAAAAAHPTSSHSARTRTATTSTPVSRPTRSRSRTGTTTSSTTRASRSSSPSRTRCGSGTRPA